jgi:hypothetical protein
MLATLQLRLMLALGALVLSVSAVASALAPRSTEAAASAFYASARGPIVDQSRGAPSPPEPSDILGVAIGALVSFAVPYAFYSARNRLIASSQLPLLELGAARFGATACACRCCQGRHHGCGCCAARAADGRHCAC